MHFPFSNFKTMSHKYNGIMGMIMQWELYFIYVKNLEPDKKERLWFISYLGVPHFL